jgi:hypothetical protein
MQTKIKKCSVQIINISSWNCEVVFSFLPSSHFDLNFENVNRHCVLVHGKANDTITAIVFCTSSELFIDKFTKGIYSLDGMCIMLDL